MYARRATMTFPPTPNGREPKGDHNRRLSLGLDLDQFAREAGVTPGDLTKYEITPPDDDFDLDVAQHVGSALERLEARSPKTQKIENAL
jgi:transcriptional regulator with XRE-family HTH domain